MGSCRRLGNGCNKYIVSPKTGDSPDGFLCKKLQTVWENLLGFPFRDVRFLMSEIMLIRMLVNLEVR